MAETQAKDWDGIYYSGPVHLGSRQAVLDRFRQPPPVVAVDTETISLEERDMIGIGVAFSPEEAFYFPTYSSYLHEVADLLTNPSITKVFHNSMFDLGVIVKEFGFFPQPTADTMLMALQHKLPLKLKTLAAGFHWDIDDMEEVLASVGSSDTSLVPEYITADKCCWDIRATYKLWQILEPHTNLPLLYRDGKVQQVLTKMSIKGVKIDHSMRLKYKELIIQEYQWYKDYCYELYEFNPGSPDQVAYVLNMRGVSLPIKKPENGWGSEKKTRLMTEESELLKVSGLDPLAAMIINYRDLAKQLGTYIEPFEGRDRIHPEYHMMARTSRISGRNPNPMNIPKPLRGMYVPDSSTFTTIDYIQQELRILAYLSRDKAMLDLFEINTNCHKTHNHLPPKCADFHNETAKFMDCDRDSGKTTTFALVYGAGNDTIAENAHTTIVQAAQLRTRWATAYPEAYEWMEGQKQTGIRDGIVYTALGRPLPLPSPQEDLEGESGVGRKAINYPIQGTGAEIEKGSMLILDEAGADLRIPVHDEHVADGEVEVPEGIEHIVDGLHTPVQVRSLTRWQ